MRLAFVVMFTAALLMGCQNEQKTAQPGEEKPVLTFTSLDPQFDVLIGAARRHEVLGSGYLWSEGPAWVPGRKALFFTDVPGNVMYRWKAGEAVGEFMNPSGYSGPDSAMFREPGMNGLFWDADMGLLACDCGSRALVLLDLDARQKTILAGSYDGKRLNSPNDCVSRDGHIYFTDPPYGLNGINDSPHKEQDANGVYHLDPAGKLTRLTGELSYPNGIAISPAGDFLYVSCSDPKRAIWMRYPRAGNGSVAVENGELFFDATALAGAGAPGLPDGMAVDQNGNIFATGPGGVLLFSPEGKHLGTIATGSGIANCAFGEDGHTLFLTANDRLIRLEVATRGLGF
ncbi:MAG TPA: SMP-30/gluconolactonase/LRE family protein [Calditrichia bacterium]|nr:SMP-30/gluconolactonase/LRE family protein [Calditrichia bacterium]